MNPGQQREWQDSVLREILRAVASHPPLKEALVFKGARILNLHLGTERQSLDIDANLLVEFQQAHPDHAEQSAWFQEQLEHALRNHFEEQEPVRYGVTSVKVEPSPQKPHPRGWDAFKVAIRVTDERMRGVRQLPTIELDLAAPEELGSDAICHLQVDGAEIQAYSLHRIAGEKLRAFLTSLPSYRNKMLSPERAVRAKDLHDLARILAAKPIDDTSFWTQAGKEFRLACMSRHVDCHGPETFREGWSDTQVAYESDATLKAVPWSDAEQALEQITKFFDEVSVFPLVFPLPDPEAEP
jgi:hypothetical protein